MEKIGFRDWKSCCVRREIGVEKRHANFQVVAHGLRGGFLCEFHIRPRGRHSDASRPACGFGPKNGRIGQARNPGAARFGHFSWCREGESKQTRNQDCPRQGNDTSGQSNHSGSHGNGSSSQDKNSNNQGNDPGNQSNYSSSHGNGSGSQGNNSGNHSNDAGNQGNNSGDPGNATRSQGSKTNNRGNATGGPNNNSGNQANDARANPNACGTNCG